MIKICGVIKEKKNTQGATRETYLNLRVRWDQRASWRKWHLRLDLKHSGKKRGKGWGEVAPRRDNV